MVFIDAIHVKVRDGQVANRPFHVAMGVTTAGERDVLMLVRDGLKGLPEAVGAAWPRAVVQTSAIHLLRSTFRYASTKHWHQMVRELRPVYTAPSEQAAKERFGEFAATWGKTYPAVIRLWERAWSEFVPFLDYDAEVRRIIRTSDAIESLNARHRRAVRARGHFLSEQAALKCLYLMTRSLDPTGRGQARWVTRRKPALNAFSTAFEGRINPSGSNQP